MAADGVIARILFDTPGGDIDVFFDTPMAYHMQRAQQDEEVARALAHTLAALKDGLETEHRHKVDFAYQVKDGGPYGSVTSVTVRRWAYFQSPHLCTLHRLQRSPYTPTGGFSSDLTQPPRTRA